jgi:aspartate/methionine/tyrosine aminotransferase
MDIKEQMTTTSLRDRLKIAARSRVAPFIAMDVLARANGHAAAGRDVIHLEVGEPGSGAPAPVLAAAQRALEGGRIVHRGSGPARAARRHCRALPT